MRMQWIGALLGLFLMPALEAQELTATAVDARKTVCVQRDTPVALLVMDAIDSSRNARGNTVHFALKNDLVADGVLVAKAGTQVTAQMVEVQRRNEKHNGNVRLGRMLVSTNGANPILLRGGDTAAEGWDDTGAFVVGAVVFFPITLLALPALAIRAHRNNQHTSFSRRLATKDLHLDPGATLFTTVAKTSEVAVKDHTDGLTESFR